MMNLTIEQIDEFFELCLLRRPKRITNYGKLSEAKVHVREQKIYNKWLQLQEKYGCLVSEKEIIYLRLKL
jgi:hypothetical protein